MSIETATVIALAVATAASPSLPPADGLLFAARITGWEMLGTEDTDALAVASTVRVRHL